MSDLLTQLNGGSVPTLFSCTEQEDSPVLPHLKLTDHLHIPGAGIYTFLSGDSG